MENLTNVALQKLRSDNADLRKRVEELEAQLSFLGQHKHLAAGMKGERLISNTTGGKLTLHTAAVDVITTEGILIEVKYAKKTASTPGYPNYMRWQWQKVFGEVGNKNYDYLLLIGEVDERYRSQYMDPSAPFVIFCLSPDEVRPIMTKGTRGAHGINLSCNPTNDRGIATRLFQNNQLTTADLAERFGAASLDYVSALVVE